MFQNSCFLSSLSFKKAQSWSPAEAEAKQVGTIITPVPPFTLSVVQAHLGTLRELLEMSNKGLSCKKHMQIDFSNFLLVTTQSPMDLEVDIFM